MWGQRGDNSPNAARVPETGVPSFEVLYPKAAVGFLAVAPTEPRLLLHQARPPGRLETRRHTRPAKLSGPAWRQAASRLCSTTARQPATSRTTLSGLGQLDWPFSTVWRPGCGTASRLGHQQHGEQRLSPYSGGMALLSLQAPHLLFGGTGHSGGAITPGWVAELRSAPGAGYPP